MRSASSQGVVRLIAHSSLQETKSFTIIGPTRGGHSGFFYASMLNFLTLHVPSARRGLRNGRNLLRWQGNAGGIRAMKIGFAAFHREWKNGVRLKICGFSGRHTDLIELFPPSVCVLISESVPAALVAGNDWK
jgi:hypothetical protein